MDTIDGKPMTQEQQDDYDWAGYARWAIGPLMTREQWQVRRTRIAEMSAAGTLPTNPYEW